MHRWFYANEEAKCEPSPPSTPPTPATPVRTPTPEIVPDTLWKFTVKYWGKLCTNEYLAVTGSIEQLGNWSVEDCVLLQKDDTSGMSTIELLLPRKDDIRFRYLVCATADNGEKIIRFWETHYKARWIRCNDKQNAIDFDIFGKRWETKKVQRGWLMPNTNVVQLMFYQAPFDMKEMEVDTLMYVKVSPILLDVQHPPKSPQFEEEAFGEEEAEAEAEEEEEEETLEANFAFCEVASLKDENDELRYQAKYGTVCGPTDLVMFHLTIGNMERTAYLINLYNYPAKAGPDIPPYHVGYQYIQPQHLNAASGTIKLNVMCATKHQCIGKMTCNYLVVKPLPDHTFDLKESLKVPRKKIGAKPFDIGHRGCGLSYWWNQAILRENTINSFNIALEHGADMVEFDVQLTKDKIPIIYHDFMLYISPTSNLPPTLFDILKLNLTPKERGELTPHMRTVNLMNLDVTTLPTNKLALKQLQRIRPQEIKMQASLSKPCLVDQSLNLPFPTLQYALEYLPKSLGFNVEIKYTQQYDNGLWEENFQSDFDKNEYIDIILDIILRYASTRQIVFSSFDADCCTMVRLKQNRFPVCFLVNSQTQPPKYLDPRGDSILTSSYFASAMELFGIVPDSQDVIKATGEIAGIHRRNLMIFVWGMLTRNEQHRKDLHNRHVDAVIFDRINHVLEPPTLIHSAYIIELIDWEDDSEQDLSAV